MEVKKSVVLVLPDSGPLISLSIGHHLDLLLRLGIPIFIVDEVLRECTLDPSRPGARTIVNFVLDNPERVFVGQTFVGEMADRVRKEGKTPGRGLVEAAAAEFFANIDRFIDPADPVLILFEDNDIPKINAVIRGNVHILSTWGLLKGMERAGLIHAYEEAWLEGRNPHRNLVDREAPESYGGSRWIPDPPEESACGPG